MPPHATPRGRGAFAGLLAAAMATKPQAPPVPRAPERPIPSQPASPEGKLERRSGRHPDDEPERDAKHARAPVDPLDPAMRNPAIVAPPVAAPAAPAPVEAMEAPRARMSMEELLPALVRRIAWTGDKHKGTVRLELGAGAHAGTTLLVHADGARVRVEVHGVEGRDLDDFRRRLDARLRGHGLDVESVS